MKSEMVGIDISENLEDFCFHCKKADFVVRAFYDFNEDIPRTKYEFSCSHLGLCRQLAEHLKTTLPKQVDAAQVVRCKDCKYKDENGYCTFYRSFRHLTDDMDYCSDAKRKEE